MRNCLITGATGLIGSHLLSVLPMEWQVYCLSRKPYQGNHAKRSVAYITADLTNPLHYSALPPNVEAVIHLAQSEHFREFPNKAYDVFQVNVASTLQLLEYARQAGARTLVLASSGGVYGHHDHEFSEDVAVTANADLGFYLGTKLCAEIMAENYTPFMNIIVLRFFFVYGAGQRKSMLIPRLVQSVQEARAITLQGEDGIRINPTYVLDAANAIVRALDLDGSHKINVGGPEVLSLRQIGEVIGRALTREPKFELQRAVQPHHLVGDIGKMAQLLGPPHIRFEEGINMVLTQEGVHRDG